MPLTEMQRVMAALIDMQNGMNTPVEVLDLGTKTVDELGPAKACGVAFLLGSIVAAHIKKQPITNEKALVLLLKFQEGFALIKEAAEDGTAEAVRRQIATEVKEAN